MGFLTQKLEARLRLGGDLPSELMFNGFYPVARNVFQDLKSVENLRIGKVLFYLKMETKLALHNQFLL